MGYLCLGVFFLTSWTCRTAVSYRGRYDVAHAEALSICVARADDNPAKTPLDAFKDDDSFIRVVARKSAFNDPVAVTSRCGLVARKPKALTH